MKWKNRYRPVERRVLWLRGLGFDSIDGEDEREYTADELQSTLGSLLEAGSLPEEKIYR